MGGSYYSGSASSKTVSNDYMTDRDKPVVHNHQGRWYDVDEPRSSDAKQREYHSSKSERSKSHKSHKSKK
jgi:hypothetical protein